MKRRSRREVHPVREPLHFRHTPNMELSEETYRYLVEFERQHRVDDVLGHLDAITGKRVLVVGEVILDQYDYVEPMGKSAKDAVLASRHLYDEVHAGGAVAIANHVAAFAERVELVSALGERDRREDLVRAHLRDNVRATFVTKSGSPTILKRRIVDNYSGAKLLEVYDFDDSLLNERDDARFCEMLSARIHDVDLVIVADFGHGLMTPRAIELVQADAPFLALNVQTNSANLGFNTVSKYHRADFVSIQEREIRLDRRDRTGDLSTLIDDLGQALGAKSTLVTRGKYGTLLVTHGEAYECPSLATHVVDRVGAGDAVFAVSALCALAGLPAPAFSFVANAVGAVAVTIVGNREPVDRAELEDYIRFLLTEVGE